MRTALLALAAVVSGLSFSAPAQAQLALDITTVDPLTKLPADKWVQLATRIVNPAPIVGKDAVYVVNATGEDLSSVTCRGYFLVGMSPYITGNKTTNAPATLPKWTVSLVPTEGFNTYCKGGVEATGIVANYHGMPNAGDKSLANSTFIVFAQPKS